ncbi:MAG: pitrilysin family protein [Candidatus Aminicenantes bacterium]|nr:pitrilysin family protein [Candidatus Aminicenantes bacterium]
MKKIFSLIFGVCVLVLASGLAQIQKPGDLKYPVLKYDPPDPKAFRTVLAGGLRAYVQEDHSLPAVNISALVNFGSLYVPEGMEGLDSLLSGALIRGGTKTREGTAVEERIDFLGGLLNFTVGERTSSLTLSVLSKDLDEGLALFFDVLMNPEFREEPFALAKARAIEQLRQANDQPGGILSREYEKILYGTHALTRRAMKKTYENITSADLKAVHSQYFVPKNIILTASGDFVKADLAAKINTFIRAWKGKDVKIPVFSKAFPTPEPGVYFIQKPINQGYISLGHLGLEDTDPDYPAVQVMNFILGGGSFTSRITTKVRSNEGLSYNQGSRFTTRWGFPGTFAGYVQTKSSTVGYAISLIEAEFDRIRKEQVSDAEMDTAVNYFIDSFSSQFEMPQGTMNAFANLEMQGKPMDYYKTYRDKIKAVTKAKVLDVAQKFIRPEKTVIMIVGDFEPCNKGGEKWAGPLEKLGKLHRINLIDPMTGAEIK